MKRLNESDAMNPDEFEQDLKRRTIRPVPTEWRAEILRAANAAAFTAHASPTTPSLLASIYHQLSSILWPSPLAWGGLAALWMVAAGFIYASSSDSKTTVMAQSAQPSTELKTALREQRRTLAQLLESPEMPVAEPPKSFVPRPRGELKLESVMV
jgi:hypothetical protein